MDPSILGGVGNWGADEPILRKCISSLSAVNILISSAVFGAQFSSNIARWVIIDATVAPLPPCVDDGVKDAFCFFD